MPAINYQSNISSCSKFLVQMPTINYCSAVKLIVDDIENFKSSIQDKMTDEEKERLIKSVCI